MFLQNLDQDSSSCAMLEFIECPFFCLVDDLALIKVESSITLILHIL